MKTYAVTFIRYYEYLVEAPDEFIAKDEAYTDFCADVVSMNDKSYDDVTIEVVSE